VDRQDIQSLMENEWNKCVLHQLPRLFVCLMKWIANASPTPNLQISYSLFPPLVIDENEILCTNILGQRLLLDNFVEIIKNENVIPVYNDVRQLKFMVPKKVIWLPPSLMLRIPIKLLITWFGLSPLSTIELGDMMWLPLWKPFIQFPTELLFKNRKKNFSFRSTERDEFDFRSISIQLMAAIGEAMALQNQSAVEINANSSLAKGVSEKVTFLYYSKAFIDDLLRVLYAII
jgi:hypothetical protein